jgi:hypothetical protein
MNGDGTVRRFAESCGMFETEVVPSHTKELENEKYRRFKIEAGYMAETSG